MTTFRGLKKAFGAITTTTAVAAFALGIFGGMTEKAANAQAIVPAVIKPFAVKLGAYTPSEPEARKASSDVLLSLEAEYTIQSLVEQNSSYSVISIGYIKHSDLQIIPITIGQNFTDGRKSYYYGLGVGLYNVKMNLPGVTSNDVKNIFGFYGTVGMNFTPKFFGELKYHYPYKYDGQFIGGIQAMAGYRF